MIHTAWMFKPGLVFWASLCLHILFTEMLVSLTSLSLRKDYIQNSPKMSSLHRILLDLYCVCSLSQGTLKLNKSARAPIGDAYWNWHTVHLTTCNAGHICREQGVGGCVVSGTTLYENYILFQEAQRAAKTQKQAEAGVKHKTSTEGMHSFYGFYVMELLVLHGQ